MVIEEGDGVGREGVCTELLVGIERCQCTVKSLRQAWGEYDLTNGAGIFRSFSVKMEKEEHV